MPAICVIAGMFARGDFATQANQSPNVERLGAYPEFHHKVN